MDESAKRKGLLSNMYSPYSAQDPTLNVPVTAGPAGHVMSPYLGIDPSIIQGGPDSQYIFPNGPTNRHRGRFEQAFTFIGSSVFVGCTVGSITGLLLGYKTLSKGDSAALKRTHLLNNITRKASGYGQPFGVVAVIYSGLALLIGGLRGEEPGSYDIVTSASSGTITGALFRSEGIFKAGGGKKVMIGASVGLGLATGFHMMLSYLKRF